MATHSKRVYFKDNIMIRSLDEPVTTPCPEYALGLLESGIEHAFNRLAKIQKNIGELEKATKND